MIGTKRRLTVGFTIVELLVVIVVIGILAMVTVFSMNGWRERTARNGVQNDLKAASTAMENEKNFNNGYPAWLPASFKPSDDVTVTVKLSTPTSYCIEGTSKTVPTVLYSISSDSKTPVANGC